MNEVLRAAVERFDRAFDGYAWEAVGPSLSCGETDALADLLRALGLGDQAETLIVYHGEDDDEGDPHYQGGDSEVE